MEYILSFTQYAFVLGYLAVFIIGIIGNCLVMVIFAKRPYMRTVTNAFLVTLAAGDFLFILGCMPFIISEDLAYNFQWHFGHFMCKTVKYLQVSCYCTKANHTKL
ncbi:hypothetical protein Ciccas_013477 [Cichlidogyrus casuarinus]|uniref:G-protein coupled receptors family 1 profile domain-containing protein n=1 Tax=Cichlidogyrus casuarinus TaxID=1844966 RepID=A0ABD2PLY5_9PLAT